MNTSIMENVTKAICEVCGQEYDEQILYQGRKHHYCYACKYKVKVERQNNRRRIVVKEEMKVIPDRKPKAKLIADNLDWFNAGLSTGKQGHLRDKFYELFTKLDDFLLVMDELGKDQKYLAEMQGLDYNQRRAWLIGFFTAVNKGGV